MEGSGTAYCEIGEISIVQSHWHIGERCDALMGLPKDAQEDPEDPHL